MFHLQPIQLYLIITLDYHPSFTYSHLVFQNPVTCSLYHQNISEICLLFANSTVITLAHLHITSHLDYRNILTGSDCYTEDPTGPCSLAFTPWRCPWSVLAWLALSRQMKKGQHCASSVHTLRRALRTPGIPEHLCKQSGYAAGENVQKPYEIKEPQKSWQKTKKCS